MINLSGQKVLLSHSSNFWIFNQGNHWKIKYLDYMCFDVFLRGHHQCDVILKFHPYRFSHSKNMQAWIWVWTLQWRKLEHTYVQMMSLYLPITSRFWKSIVFILPAGNQWTSLCDVMMIHVNIFPYILSASYTTLLWKFKYKFNIYHFEMENISQLFILILVLLILNTSYICNVYYFSKIIYVWYSEIM